VDAWSGIRRDPDHKRHALSPKSGFIRDKETWAEVWAAWRGPDPLPEVDFDNDVVYATASPGPNRLGPEITIHPEEGRVFGSSTTTKLGGPYVSYLLIQARRKGVTEFRGKSPEKYRDERQP